MMEFGKPLMLYFLLAVPVVLLLYGYGAWRKRAGLRVFADSERLLLGVNWQRYWWQTLLLTLAAAVFIIALAEPRWGIATDELGRQGRDIYFMLDTSLSMLAEDLTPNRLGHAKNGIRDFIELIRQEGGHRVGLIAFAGRANLQCPLTLDYDFFLRRLDALTTGTVPRKGTLIGEAIRQGLQGFGTLDYEYTDIILISDGEDHGSFPLDAAKLVKTQNVGFYAIGIGDDGEGSLIPIKNPAGETDFLQYQEHEVRSRLRQSLLIDLARIAGGSYEAAGLGALRLDRLYQTHIADKPRRAIDETSGELPAHRFQWLVLAGLILLIAEFLWRNRPSGGIKR